MLKIIDVSFYKNAESELGKVAAQHAAAHLYAEHLGEYATVEIIKHTQVRASIIRNGIAYQSFKSNNHFFHIPLATIRYIAASQPDVVLVQGLAFPIQVLWLRLRLGRGPVIIVQHHGEQPSSGIKGYFQRLMARFVTAFLFTSAGNVRPWIDSKIFSSRTKHFEIPGASTHFRVSGKEAAKRATGVEGKFNFLWVANLNPGKDPLTVIEAFAKIYQNHPATLYLFYHSKELLPHLHQKLNDYSFVKKRIILMGSINHDDLEVWFNAADFFISASHHEAMGYALVEAMATGCIPVVTDIPSHREITANGNCGLFFRAGEIDSLIDAFKMIPAIDRELLRFRMNIQFQEALSPQAIANKFIKICKMLLIRQQM